MAGEEDLDGGSKVWDRVINGHLLSSSGWDLKEGWVDQGQIGAGPDSEPYEPPDDWRDRTHHDPPCEHSLEQSWPPMWGVISWHHRVSE
ncbi:hypothetical protein N7468_005423 [Penicillium chermesinum]|uniref:Uncharacterized protein n=1 Tax=Penicillium chermesinum TaxID=63820 RepID=A0A9W9P1M1_9EURO|nr:uncharacterized protein N7468_005423 [Penicillium chermesinum]KAJ5232467.1 hypothetical protein N7468_005423 [Penicillium chermesinum]